MSAADCVAVLEACPFCGLDVTNDEGCFPMNPGRTIWEVRCGNPFCFAHDPASETREKAIAKWNRRALRRDGEPVAWMYRHKPTGTIAAVVGADRSDFFADNPSCERLQPLYATPSPKGPTTP